MYTFVEVFLFLYFLLLYCRVLSVDYCSVGCQTVLTNARDPAYAVSLGINDYVVMYVKMNWTLVNRVNGVLQYTTNVQGGQFFPQVDKYTSLSIPNTQAILKYGAKVHVELMYQNVLLQTDSRLFYDNSNFVPFRTIIITLDKGNLQSISWEPTNCVLGCQCVVDTCGRPEDNCDFNNANSSTTPCDVQVFVGWQGTDKRGINLISAGSSIWRVQYA